MRLYSKKALVFSSLLGIIFGAIIMLSLVSLLESPKVKNEKVSETSENDEKISRTGGIDASDESEISERKIESGSGGKTAIQSEREFFNSVKAPGTKYTEDETQNIYVYDLCNGAVVNINTKVAGVNWFLEPIVEDGGSGSGAIIDARGYVLTNVHVIQGASKIYVSLSDGTQYEANVVGTDDDSDLAVIKFTPPSNTILQTIQFGDSTSLKVGQKVIAIGNPFGFERTMTVGIVSALGRPIKNSRNRIIRNMIQTDTAINPGNSGGPLLDTTGKMIGINTMIYSSSGNSAGIGFAVPAETAVRVTEDLLRYGVVQRGIIEASLVQLNNRIANYADLDIAKGMLVSEVTKGGNAEKAGVFGGKTAARYGGSIIYLGGDVITKIDEVAVSTIADYYSMLENKKVGDVVKVTLHRNRRDREVRITLAKRER